MSKSAVTSLAAVTSPETSIVELAIGGLQWLSEVILPGGCWQSVGGGFAALQECLVCF